MKEHDDPYLASAIKAAKESGALLRENFGKQLEVDALEQHDIKLALDVKSQEMITANLLGDFPDHAILGEEGTAGSQDSPYEWVVDPIDGTVNYYYGIPHFCISIALRHNKETIAGMIYDPMLDEVWACRQGQKPTQNGETYSPSSRDEWKEAMITVGFSKTKESLDEGLGKFKNLAYKVRKIRMLGSAALGLAYVSCGRLDAYIEEQINLWDIAAGVILLQEAGGYVKLTPRPEAGYEKYSIIATNGKLPLSEL